MNEPEKTVYDIDNLHVYWCDGCDMRHHVDETWGFNGDYVKPTFTPSVLVTWTGSNNPRLAAIDKCHTFVTDGVVDFLGDTGHTLAGQKVPLQPLSAWKDKQ